MKDNSKVAEATVIRKKPYKFTDEEVKKYRELFGDRADIIIRHEELRIKSELDKSDGKSLAESAIEYLIECQDEG